MKNRVGLGKSTSPLRPEDMNIAGFRFHGLQGKAKRWSVRVAGNYRITFAWLGENAGSGSV